MRHYVALSGGLFLLVGLTIKQ